MSVLRLLGPQRVMLLTLVIAVASAGPVAAPHTPAQGWSFWPQVLAPVFAGILIFVLPLDIMMSRLFQREAPAAEAARYGTIIRIQAGALLLVVLAWAPFMIRLLDG